MNFRIGSGFDMHAFDLANPGPNIIKLCGIGLEHNYGITSHSDGDVAFHALTDALLGSLALGSIGQQFPPTEPQWKGCDSAFFVDYANNIIVQSGWIISNIDITIICQKPKIMFAAPRMIANTARLLSIKKEQVNVKAVTTEFLGALGRGEGIAVQASVLISQVSTEESPSKII